MKDRNYWGLEDSTIRHLASHILTIILWYYPEYKIFTHSTYVEPELLLHQIDVHRQELANREDFTYAARWCLPWHNPPMMETQETEKVVEDSSEYILMPAKNNHLLYPDGKWNPIAQISKLAYVASNKMQNQATDCTWIFVRRHAVWLKRDSMRTFK